MKNAGKKVARIRDPETGKYNKKYARMKEGQQQPQADATALQPVEQKSLGEF